MSIEVLEGSRGVMIDGVMDGVICDRRDVRWSCFIRCTVLGIAGVLG